MKITVPEPLRCLSLQPQDPEQREDAKSRRHRKHSLEMFSHPSITFDYKTQLHIANKITEIGLHEFLKSFIEEINFVYKKFEQKYFFGSET